jgi:hypothetical protein
VTAATLSLRVQPFRLLTKAEAAHYCRRSVKKFEANAPFHPSKWQMATGYGTCAILIGGLIR